MAVRRGRLIPSGAWVVGGGLALVAVAIFAAIAVNSPEAERASAQPTFPTCADARQIVLPTDAPENTLMPPVRMHAECWSGQLVIPLNFANYHLQAAANKGFDMLFADGAYFHMDPNPTPEEQRRIDQNLSQHRAIFHVRGEGNLLVRLGKSNVYNQPNAWWADPGYPGAKPASPQAEQPSPSEPPTRESRPRDPENDYLRRMLKDFADYTPTRSERSAVRPCGPENARRTLGVGEYPVRLEEKCWTESFVVPEAFEWSVSGVFELEFPNGRRLSRPTPGDPLWTAGGEFRLRGSREVNVTVRRRQ